MTVTVTVHISEGVDEHMEQVVLSDEAEKHVRFSFNPSGLTEVAALKALAGAFITVCEKGAVARPEAGREFAVAKTEAQAASMWAVAGVTKGLNDQTPA